MLIRAADWEPRLHAVLDAYAAKPFEWGVSDCCLFIADAVQAMTGVDPAKPYRGRYSSETGARLALRRYGAGTLLATFDGAFGASVAPAFAHRGDIVLINELTAGVCMGPFGYFVGEAGLVQHPRADFTHAWAIPYE